MYLFLNKYKMWKIELKGLFESYDVVMIVVWDMF